MATSTPEDSSSSGWQETGTLAETNLYMLEHEILCDVTFLAGKAETPVKAHKFMLVSRSPVFYAMFCGPMAETQDVIAVPDVETQDLKELFRFMYTDNCTVSGENVMVLLYVAQKYSVANLVQQCSVFLTEHIGADNVCMILQQAVTFNEKELVNTCLSYVAVNCNDILNLDNVKQLDARTLKALIEYDELDMDEEKIYKICVEWARHQCESSGREVSDKNIRECLGEILYLIRFPTMPIEVYTRVVSNVNILTPEEKVEIYQSYFGMSSSGRTFSTVPRVLPRQSAVIQRFDDIQQGWSHSNRPDALSFSSISTDVLLVGVCLFTPATEGSVVGHLEILEGDQQLYRQAVRLSYDQSKKCQDVLFCRKVQLKKSNVYTYQQALLGTPTYYGDKGKCNVTVDSVAIVFQKSAKDKNSTSPGRGQLYRLLIEY